MDIIKTNDKQLLIKKSTLNNLSDAVRRKVIEGGGF